MSAVARASAILNTAFVVSAAIHTDHSRQHMQLAAIPLASPDAPIVIRFGRLGDMVLQTPLLHLLHRRYGEPCRLVTSGAWTQPLLGGCADVGEIVQLRRRHVPLLLSPQRWRLIAQLRTSRGPVYVSEDSARQVRKIRRMLALAGVSPRRCLFVTDQAIEAPHWVDRLLLFGEMTPPAFGGAMNHCPEQDHWIAPRLNVNASDRADRDAWLRVRGITGVPIVLVQAGNRLATKWGRARSNDNKAWPTEHWTSLLRAMRDALPDACLMLCGSAQEHDVLARISKAAGIHGVHVATHDLPLRRLLAVLEMAHSMVSVDTGPSHVAAAIGCPLVVLYGAESPRVWGRRSPLQRPIIELGGPPQHRRVSELAPERVIEAWLRVAASTPPRAAAM